MWWSPTDCEAIKYQINRLKNIEREIDYRILELEQLKARILSKLFVSAYDRVRLANIDAEISRLNFKRKEINRQLTELYERARRLGCL